MGRLVKIVDGPLDFEEALSVVRGPGNGAAVTFVGTTRDHSEGKSVLKLLYEAYEPMAAAKMEEIAERIGDEWGLDDVAIVHRIGEVPIGEASVVIACASPHRADAFAACRYAIDTLKQIVPIWKKEFFEDGEVWVGGRASGENGDPRT